MCQCAAAIARAVAAFLDAVLVSCFLSCFRPRPRPGSGSGSSRRDALVHRDRVGEALWDDEQGLGRSGRLCEDLVDGGDIDEEELRREANYLKLCGTISETPTELRNESHEINFEDTNECDDMPTSAPATNCTSLFEAYPSEGCGYEEHHTMRPELNIDDTHHLPGVELVPDSAFLEKTPFECINHKLLERTCSPFPTPLVLRDDMQTPGTIYTSRRGASMSGKRMRTMKQFIYPVLRPIENSLQRMELTENPSPLSSSNPPKRRNMGQIL
uniref:Uncharacterized protein n=1 Tax=Arundo donax TaxID=35708 RepID=A0A0A9FQJ3_ARUDO